MQEFKSKESFKKNKQKEIKRKLEISLNKGKIKIKTCAYKELLTNN